MLPGSGTFRTILSAERRNWKERYPVTIKVPTVLAIFFCVALAATGSSADVKTLFPELDGWEPEGEPEVYTAKTLPGYLDGPADVYMKHGFTEMGSLSYFDDQGRGLTVEIFLHGEDANAVGIFKAEQSDEGDGAAKMEIGTDAYYDYGILNFCQGQYYVKIHGYDLEDFDEDMLNIVAQIVSSNIKAETKAEAKAKK